MQQKIAHFTETITACWRRHLVASAVVLGAVYLLIFQWHFVTTGDSWAEGFTEYLTQALQSHNWSEVWSPGWAGYLTLVPSALAKLYVSLHLPLGQVDYFYRYIVIGFTLAAASFVAAPWNRRIIKSDLLRLLFALMLVMLPRDVATFSFINIWYVGLVPLMLVGLNPAKLRWPTQVGYVLYGAIILLTKPAIGIAPFLIYRAIKTKEYVSNALLFAVTILQTYFLLFAMPGGHRQVSSAVDSVVPVLAGSGVELLKLLHVAYSPAAVAVAWLTLIGAAAWLWRVRGIWMAGVAVSSFLVAVYGHVLAPGESVYGGSSPLRQVYSYGFKPQREFLIYLSIVLWLFLLLPSLISVLGRLARWKKLWRGLPLTLVASGLLVMCGFVYRPIDVSVAADLSPYRQSLQTNQSLCIPLPVAKPGGIDVHWVFQRGGGCSVENDALQLSGAHISLQTPQTIHINSPTSDHAIKSLLVPLNVPHKQQPVIALRDLSSGMTFTARVRATPTGSTFVSFNTAGLPRSAIYDFAISSSQLAYADVFAGQHEVATYPYFIGGVDAYFDKTVTMPGYDHQ